MIQHPTGASQTCGPGRVGGQKRQWEGEDRERGRCWAVCVGGGGKGVIEGFEGG